MIDSVRLKAGDVAPDIVFTEILSAGAAAPWTSANLLGRLTVLAFRPVTSHNLRSTAMWNSLVDQFGDRPVQFVWITAEYQPPLGPWLREHPLKGWVFLDPLEATALSYGMGEPTVVIIGADCRIVGFDRTMLPSARTLNAALEGRITTNTPAEGGADLVVSRESSIVHLDGEPPRMPRPEDYRPDLPPASETVHISPAKSGSGTTLSTGGNHWAALGFTLTGLLAEVYGVHESYMDLAPNLDSGVRYDVAFVPPSAESHDSIVGRVQRAIEQQFRLDVSRQTRRTDVYVLTPPDGRASSGSLGGLVGWAPVTFSQPGATAGIPTTMTDLHSGGFPFPVHHIPAIGRGFARLGPVLPFSCGGLVVDETEREGYYAIDVVCIGHRTTEELLRALREDLGIAARRERRDLKVLVVRQQPSAAP